MTEIGTVTARGSSAKGKPTIHIDGKLYYAGGTDLAGLTVGDKISFTCTSFADGKLWGIDKGWKLLEVAPKYPPSSYLAPPIPAPSPPSTGTAGIQDVERPCISNWGAELIKAGLIKDPADLGRWVIAIKNILRSQ